MKDHLSGFDTSLGKDHLVVDVPHTGDFADDDQKPGNHKVKAQCRAEGLADVFFRATSDLDRDKSLCSYGQCAGGNCEHGHEIADDRIDGKIIDAEHSQDDTGSVKVNNQHKRRTQVQRYCVAGQLAMIILPCV